MSTKSVEDISVKHGQNSEISHKPVSESREKLPKKLDPVLEDMLKHFHDRSRSAAKVNRGRVNPFHAQSRG